MVDPDRAARVAVVFRDSGSRGTAQELGPRLQPVADALRAAGLAVVPAPYTEGAEAATRRALADVHGVLVWADPLSDDGDRHALDDLLREAASTGVWVSAHPDTVDRIGTKEVLVATRDLSWGSDVHLYRTVEQLRAELPRRLAEDGVRVLKASRGNGGRTVWKVRLPDGAAPVIPGDSATVVVQHARVRDTSSESMPLSALLDRCQQAFSAWGGAGTVVDQEYVAGIASGIVRCYLVGGDVVGFARQYPEGAVPDGPLRTVARPATGEVMGLPSPKTMYPADEPAFEVLRARLEREWVPATLRALSLAPADLPALWDVDLIVDEDAETGPRFVLCEVNASSVIPFPPEAPARVAAYVVERLGARRAGPRDPARKACGGGGGI